MMHILALAKFGLSHSTEKIALYCIVE